MKRLLFVYALIVISNLSVASEIVKEDGAQAANSLERILGKGAKVSISPDVVTCDSAYTFKIRITLGAGGLSSDDSLGLVCGSNIDRWSFKFPYHYWGQMQPWQIAEPKGANFTTAKCSRGYIDLSISIGVGGPPKPYKNQPGHLVRSLRERMRFVLEIKPDSDLREGDIITVFWGDKSKNSPGVKAPSLATTYFFLPFKYSLLPERDRDLPIRRGEFLLLPHIRVKGKAPSQFYLTAQPLHRVKDKFSLNIAAVDEHGNLSEDFTGQASLSCDGFDVKLPSMVKFTKADKGHIKVDGIKFQKPGWYKIQTVSNNITGKSNYIKITKTKPDKQIYFGDMHTHTLDCDGTLWYQAHYNYARDVAGLDFGAVSCHAAYLGCKEAWDNYLTYATVNNRPGQFVTFYGYEWAGGGHINAYFLNEKDITLIARPVHKDCQPDDVPFRIFCVGEDKFIEKFKALDKIKKVFLIAHCHTKYGESVDDDLLWLDEIYSFHHKYNKIREDRYRNNLKKGLYLGVVAGSDMHLVDMGRICKKPGPLWPGPDDGMNWPRYQTPGLQATFADKLTRNGLYDAMKQRHTYGTTGQRIVLLFDIDGQNIMGDRLTLPNGRKPKFNIQVGGTDKLSDIAICKFDGQNWFEPMTKKDIEGDLWTGTWQEPQFSRSAIYYIRATQQNGSIAWSSPIWLRE